MTFQELINELDDYLEKHPEYKNKRVVFTDNYNYSTRYRIRGFGEYNDDFTGEDVIAIDLED